MAAAALPLCSETTATTTHTNPAPTAPITTVPHEVVQSALPPPVNHTETSNNQQTEVKKGITRLKIKTGLAIAVAIISALVAGFFLAMSFGLLG